MKMFSHPRPGNRANMIPLILALLLPGTGVTAADSPALSKGIVPVDRIVAVVNDEVITRFELDDRVKSVIHQLQSQGTPLPPQEALEKQVLERLIVDRAQIQFARETGVRVEDSQLDKTLQRIAQDNKLSMQEFHATLERDGINFNKFREEIREEMIMAHLKEREVDNKITVTDAEIDNYLGTQNAQTGKLEEYNLAHILVLVPEQASPDQIQAKQKKAEEALAQLKGGADFAQVAAGYSDSADALQGGALGWRPAARLPAIFVEALASMKVGEISPLLRSPNGFHVIKLLDKRGKDVAAVVTQTHVRHILIKTSELVSETDARNHLLQLKDRLDHGAKFEELARLHSEDASAASGGDLGWVSPGDTVPEFERAMNALQPGQISEPIQTPFGWHLIQVLARRTEDVSRDRQRLLARQALRSRKSDEAYQEWLRQLRDRTYVEYRLEEK